MCSEFGYEIARSVYLSVMRTIKFSHILCAINTEGFLSVKKIKEQQKLSHSQRNTLLSLNVLLSFCYEKDISVWIYYTFSYQLKIILLFQCVF